jgi:hypothetical protein
MWVDLLKTCDMINEDYSEQSSIGEELKTRMVRSYIYEETVIFREQEVHLPKESVSGTENTI